MDMFRKEISRSKQIHKVYNCVLYSLIITKQMIKMLQSYLAIYDHGLLNRLTDKPSVEEAPAIVI
jgi:hypothetical protein